MIDPIEVELIKEYCCGIREATRWFNIAKDNSYIQYTWRRETLPLVYHEYTITLKGATAESPSSIIYRIEMKTRDNNKVIYYSEVRDIETMNSLIYSDYQCNRQSEKAWYKWGYSSEEKTE